MRRRLVDAWRSVAVAVLLAAHRRPPLRGLVAFACIVTGVALLSHPAAFITAGILLVADLLTDRR